jgi:hypothetical protein
LDSINLRFALALKNRSTVQLFKGSMSDKKPSKPVSRNPCSAFTS